VTKPNRTVALTNDVELKGEYRIEYLLTAVSSYGSPKGQGWYGEGKVATVSMDSETQEAGYLVQMVLTGWQGNVSGSSTTANVAMQGPNRVTAIWTTSYDRYFYIIVQWALWDVL